MQTLYQFICTTKSRYNNTKDVDGKQLILNTEITERDAEFVNRVADVIATPTAISTPIRTGDQIIVHHNVFRTWYNQRGELADGSGFLGDGLFSVHLDQVFAYGKGGEWTSAPGFVFVSPIKEEGDPKDLMAKTLGEVPLRGNIAISNPEFESDTGATIGACVGFTPDSEYEFVIDGQRLYRIRARDINIIYNHGSKENTTTNHSLEPQSA